MTDKEVRIINGKEVVLYRHKELGSYLFSEDAVEMLLKAFEEVEQYRAIGTVEEVQKIRNKAIDEFAERLQEKVEIFQTEINGFKADVLTLDYFVEFVDEIAEQMKGGAE